MQADGLQMLAGFLAEDLGLPNASAAPVAAFLHGIENVRAVVRPKPWVSGDRWHVRVYFDLWSQNTKPAVRWCSKTWFDAHTLRVMTRNELVGRTMVLSANWPRTEYSGSQTNDAIRALLEHVECLKKRLASL